MNLKIIIIISSFILLLNSCKSRFDVELKKDTIVKDKDGPPVNSQDFNSFLKENIDFTPCLNIGLPNRTYECIPTIKKNDLNITWGFSTLNTCDFLVVGKTTGKVYGSSNQSNTFTCDLALTIKTPTLSGFYKFKIEFPNTSNFYGSGYKVMAKSGNYSYWALPGAIHVYDTTNPSSPSYLKEISSVADVYEMTVYRNFLYVVGTRGGLYIHSLVDPATPRLVSTLPGSAVINDLAFLGDKVYLAGEDKNIIVLNISNPINPIFLATIATPDSVKGIDVAGNFLYIANNKSGVSIIDITSLDTAKIISTLAYTSEVLKIKIKEDYAYVANYENGLQIINITNPFLPTRVLTMPSAGVINNLRIIGDYIYLANKDGINVLKIINPIVPTIFATFETLSSISLQVYDKHLYIPQENKGGVIYSLNDLKNPTPVIVASFNTAFQPREIAIKNNLLVSLSPSSLRITDITSKINPILLYDMPILGKASDVKIVDNYIYYTNGISLGIIDITNIAAPMPLASVPAAKSKSLFIKDNYAYVPSEDNGVMIFDITSRATPVYKKTITNVANAEEIFVKDNIAYICSSKNRVVVPEKFSGLYTVNIANLNNLIALGSHLTQEPCEGIQVRDNYAYLGVNQDGMQVLDVSRPESPLLLGSLTGISAKHISLSLSGEYAYVSSGFSGVKFVNITNPASPILEKTYLAFDELYMTIEDQNLLYLANYRAGIQIIDLK